MGLYLNMIMRINNFGKYHRQYQYTFVLDLKWFTKTSPNPEGKTTS